jgi:hypothetical protein
VVKPSPGHHASKELVEWLGRRNIGSLDVSVGGNQPFIPAAENQPLVDLSSSAGRNPLSAALRGKASILG